MRNWSYIIAVLTVCLIAALFFQHVERLSRPFLIIDALGTAAYGVVGASKASEAGLAIPACIFVGVVNAVGSGLIRDVLVREEPLLFKPGQFYVIASLLGVTEFMLVTTYAHAPIVPAAISAIAITFVFRLPSCGHRLTTNLILIHHSSKNACPRQRFADHVRCSVSVAACSRCFFFCARARQLQAGPAFRTRTSGGSPMRRFAV